MTFWVKLTDRASKSTIIVNLALATDIAPGTIDGAEINFPNRVLRVTESVEYLKELLGL
jgi:hypothetical protein